MSVGGVLVGRAGLDQIDLYLICMARFIYYYFNTLARTKTAYSTVRKCTVFTSVKMENISYISQRQFEKYTIAIYIIILTVHC